MRCIDLFAGAGGFSEGARQAGLEVAWAANHWPLAVEVHERRHAATTHACQDLNQADFTSVPEHDILLASPACQGHSTAGQGARGLWGLDYSHHDGSRSTAWAVVTAAEAGRPDWIVVENVPAFRRWQLFEVWSQALQQLGYGIEHGELDAADFGVAQNRRRLFLIARRGGAPGVLGQLPTPATRSQARESWTGMADILDVAGGERWAPVASKSERVRERVERSRPRCGDTFLTQHVRDHMGRRHAQPLPTITCADQMALVRGDEMRPLTIAEYLKGMGLPADYLSGTSCTRREACRLVGNAVCPPVAAGILETIKEVA